MASADRLRRSGSRGATAGAAGTGAGSGAGDGTAAGAGEGADARLNCLLYQRSCDVALGLPFNLWSAALLTRMIAQQVGMQPGELVWMGGDVHLYLNHAHLIEEQLSRQPQGRPTLEITRRPETIFDYGIEDFAVHDYAPLPPISAPVAV